MTFKKYFSKFMRPGRIYILPTKLGLYYFGGTFLAFVVAIFYGTSFAYAITFFFFSFLMAVSFATNYSLKDLELTFKKEFYSIPGEDCFSQLIIKNKSNDKKIDLSLSHPDILFSEIKDIEGNGICGVSFRAKEEQIKVIHVRKLNLSSTFPFGLYRAWREFSVDFKIYSTNVPFYDQHGETLYSENEIFSNLSQKGQDELIGLSVYQQGDQMSLVSWKNLARSDELLVKRYGSFLNPELFLDYDELSGNHSEKCSHTLGVALYSLRQGVPLTFQLSKRRYHSTDYNFLLNIVKEVVVHGQ